MTIHSQTPSTVRLPDLTPTLQQENPAADATRSGRGGANMYGAFSIETFCNVGALTLTHDDTAGFLGYTDKFTPHNFWFTDSGVKIWAYGENYDNWQDTYGMDAARVVYHCGHGGMDSNGVFYVPMGAAWAGNDCTAASTMMRLGNEHARYVFWSTCESLRVLGGHSPTRTWSVANLGLRMMFGFETVSWDDARYGSGFWKHWNAGESFSSAWLNSSWDIAHDQAPSVSAWGASPDEAKNRLYNERIFQADRASTAWTWWRWYNTASSAVRKPSHTPPRDPHIALLAPLNVQSSGALADRFDMDISSSHRRGSFRTMETDDRRLSISDDGMFSARLGRPNLENKTPLSQRESIATAQEAVRQFGLDSDADLLLDRVVELCEGGATHDGDGQAEGPFTTGTMVQFRQMIEGMPVLTHDGGTVQVMVDNDGKAVDLRARTRTVDALSDRPRTSASEPVPPGRTTPPNDDDLDPERALSRAFGDRLRRALATGPAPIGFSNVPGSMEVGYELHDATATLVAQRAVEVEFAGGYRKRYWIKAPLFG